MSVCGITFNGRHSYRDYGLFLETMAIAYPEAKALLVDIPGADGNLDLTTALTGDVKYGPRDVEFVFSCIGTFEEWQAKLNRIAADIHGQEVRMILDTDKNFFYTARLSIAPEKSDDTLCQITISGQADPYKYDLTDGLEPWLWDTLNFRTGIIRNYKNLQVAGARQVTVLGRRKKVIPEITCSTAMSLECEGKVFSLAAGWNKVYGLALGEGRHILTFSGNGTVSMSYRGGEL